MTAWYCKTGDYHRRIQLDLSGFDTTGASGVTFRMVATETGAVAVNDRPGTLLSSTRIGYQFAAPELDVAGTYRLEATLTYADGRETVPTVGTATVVISSRI